MSDANTFRQNPFNLDLSKIQELTKIINQNRELISTLEGFNDIRALTNRDQVENFHNKLLETMPNNIGIVNDIAALQKLKQDILGITSNFQTSIIVEKLRSKFNDNLFASGIESFRDSIGSSVISSPSISLLKLSPQVLSLTKSVLPSGLATAIKDLHVTTAEHISRTNNITFNVEKSEFVVDNDKENGVSAKTVNAIVAADHYFEDISANELVDFLSFLAKNTMLGLSHDVGRKIQDKVNMISDSDLIDFDSEYFYHGRALDDEACPYDDERMLKAPTGIPPSGRYNAIGQSAYYFSDREKGALSEVRIHRRNTLIQMVKLQPTRKIKLFDISADYANEFIKFCRYKTDKNDASIVPRQYLIPSFFAGCCREAGINGIKYYGSKEYSNYVTWDEHFFSIVEHSIIAKR